jgi:hypothetical protein
MFVIEQILFIIGHYFGLILLPMLQVCKQKKRPQDASCGPHFIQTGINLFFQDFFQMYFRTVFNPQKIHPRC